MRHLTKEVIELHLSKATCFNDVIRSLGYVPTGNTAKKLKEKFKEFDI